MYKTFLSKYMSGVPSTGNFKSTASRKKCTFLNMPAKLTFKELTFLYWEIIAACNVSQNAAFPQVFFCHTLRTAPKKISSFSASHYVPFKFMHAFIHKQKMQIFDPKDLHNGCQMMSYAYVEKDLNENEHLSLTFKLNYLTTH